MDDSEIRALLVDAGRKILALEACFVALAQDRLVDLSGDAKAVKVNDLLGYARRHIEACDLAQGGLPTPAHDLAKESALGMAHSLISNIA